MSDDVTADVSVNVSKDGPLTIKGPVSLVGSDGKTWTDVPEGSNVALCRCGQSKVKPFCDGSHRAAGFDSAPTPADQPYPW
jgi:CDGSH iron-sulfur domain-containing protein 3